MGAAILGRGEDGGLSAEPFLYPEGSVLLWGLANDLRIKVDAGHQRKNGIAVGQDRGHLDCRSVSFVNRAGAYVPSIVKM